MISDTPSPPQPSRTVWTSKRCPPCWGTTTLALPCAPTPTPHGRSRTRPPRPWAASWVKSYKRVKGSKKPGGKSDLPVRYSFVLSCRFGVWVAVWGRNLGPHRKTTICNKKSPKTEVFRDFWSCWADLNRRPHPYQATFELFSNYFSHFMALFTPICSLSVTLGNQGFRPFRRPLWLTVWSGR